MVKVPDFMLFQIKFNILKYINEQKMENGQPFQKDAEKLDEIKGSILPPNAFSIFGLIMLYHGYNDSWAVHVNSLSFTCHLCDKQPGTQPWLQHSYISTEEQQLQ